MRWFVAERSKISPKFIHHEYLLAPADGEVFMALPKGFGASCSTCDADARGFKEGSHIPLKGKSLLSIMEELGHEYVTILRLDIEGAEYQIVDSIAENYQRGTIAPKICQILIE